ncbi:MAG: hypothetical protein ACYCWW_10505, partial [Deltaproteobacteria bacterium]
MPTSRTPVGQPTDRNEVDLPPSGFELRLDRGRAFIEVSGRPLTQGLTVRRFSMEVPGLRFPFDVTGGADRFRDRRCLLRELELVVEASSLGRFAMRAFELDPLGLAGVEVAFRPGGLEVLAYQAAAGPLTLKVGLEPDGSALTLVLHDLRLYRPAPLCAALLVHRLARAVPASRDRAAPEVEEADGEPTPLAPEPGPLGSPTLRLDPLPAALRALLVTRGFKLPEIGGVRLASIELAGGSAVLGFRSEGPSLPAVAELLSALEGGRRFGSIETLIAEGELARARKELLAASASGPPHPFAAERLLQLLASDPSSHDVALDLCALWREWLPGFAPALWVEAGIRRIAEPTRAARLLCQLADQALLRRELFSAGVAASEAVGLSLAAGDDELLAQALALGQSARPEDPELLVATAELAERRGDLPRALSALRRVAAFAEDGERSARAHARLGRLFLQSASDLPRARLHLDRALELDPADRESLLLLAEACETGGEELRALRLFDRAQQLAEASGQRHEAAALALRAGRLWDERVGHADNALLRYREAAEAFRALGDAREVEALALAAPLCERLGRWAEAVELRLAQLERTSPGRARAEALLAIARTLSERLSDGRAAELSVARALAEDPGFLEAALELCRLRRKGPPEPLREALAAATALSEGPARAALSTELGELELRALGDPRAASAAFEEALALAPDSIVAARGFAEATERLGEPRRLARALERLASLEADPPEKLRTFRRIIEIAERLRAPELAASVRLGLSTAPDAPVELLERLRALHRAHGEEAEAAALALLIADRRIAGGDRLGAAVLLLDEAESRLRASDAEGAAPLLRRARDIAPESPAVLQLEVELAERRGDAAATRSALIELLAILDEGAVPDAAARAYLRLGAICERLGLSAEAAEAFEAAAKLGSEPDRALERLAALHLGQGHPEARASALERLAEHAEARGEDAAARWIEAASLVSDPERASEALERAARGSGELAAKASRLLAALWDGRGDGRRAEAALWRWAERLPPGEERARCFEELAGRSDALGAERAIQLAAEADPARATAQVGLAGILLARGEARAALQAARRALGQGPRLPSDIELYGEAVAAAAAELCGDEAALEHVERMVELEPGERHWLERRVALCRGSGQEEAALLALIAAVPREEAPGPLCEIGRLRRERGDLASAAEAYLQALEWVPGDRAALDGALDCVPREPLGRRIELLRRRAELGDATAPQLVELAELLELSGDPEVAAAWAQAAGRSPSEPRTLARWAAALERGDRLAEAALVWGRAAEAGGLPEAGRAAELALRLGDPEGALRLLQRYAAPGGATSEGLDGPGWRLLADACHALDRRKEEAAALEAALALCPAEGSRLWPRLADARRSLGDREGEREALAQALSLLPRDPGLLSRLRDACVALEDWEGASDALAGLSSDRSDPVAAVEASLELAALAMDRLGSPPRAAAALRRALALEPDCVEALQRLGELKIAQGEVRAGLALLARACERLPAGALAAARARLATRARELGEVELALGQARAALQAGEDPEALRLAAEILYPAGAVAEALPLLERLAASDFADEPEAGERFALWFAEAQEAAGDLRGARAALLSLLRERPTCEAALRRLSDTTADLTADAAAGLLLEWEEASSSPSVRAQLLEEAGRRLAPTDPGLAAALFQRAGTARPSPRLRAEVRRCLELTGDFEALSDAWVEEIEEARQSGDGTAEIHALEALAEGRRQAGDLEGCALVLEELGQEASAADARSRAIAAFAEAAEAWKALGQSAQALEAHRRALALGAGREVLGPALELGRSVGSPTSRAELLELALTRADPAEVRSLRLELADLAAGPLADLPRAERELGLALALAPDDDEVGERLCGLWVRTGERRRAGLFLAGRGRTAGDTARARRLFERAAEELLAGGDSSGAASILLEGAAADVDAALVERVADAALEAGGFDAAAELLERLVERPSFGGQRRTLERCADALRGKGDPSALARFLEAHAEGSPDPVRWLIEAASLWTVLEGQGLASAGEARRRCARRAFVLSPEDAALFAAAVGGLDQADPSEWEAILGLRARAVPSEAVGLHRTIGETWLGTRRPDEAASAFEAALAAAPDDPLSLAGRAESAFARGEALEPWARRLVAALEGRSSGPERSEAAYRIGGLLFQEGSYELSAKLLEAALEAGTTSRQTLEALRTLDEIACATGDREARLSACRRRWQASSGAERDEALGRLAELLQPTDTGAVDILTEAVERNPEREEIVDRLTSALELAGDWTGLCRLLERQIPDGSRARAATERVTLALRAAEIANAKLGDVDRAARAFELAVLHAAVDPELLRAIATAVHGAPPRLEDQVLGRLLEVVPPTDRAELVVRRARIAEATFDPARASRAWEEVVALGPGAPGYAEALERRLRRALEQERFAEAVDDELALAACAAPGPGRARWLQEAAKLVEDGLRDPARAIELLREASAEADDARAFTLLGEALDRAGRTSEAAAALELEIARREAGERRLERQRRLGLMLAVDLGRPREALP